MVHANRVRLHLEGGRIEEAKREGRATPWYHWKSPELLPPHRQANEHESLQISQAPARYADVVTTWPYLRLKRKLMGQLHVKRLRQAKYWNCQGQSNCEIQDPNRLLQAERAMAETPVRHRQQTWPDLAESEVSGREFTCKLGKPVKKRS